jgi:two-component system, response regulator PdtaR
MVNETILIVEDEGLIALQMTEILEHEGYRIFGPFSSGFEAIQAIRAVNTIDLMLVDITLTGTLDGIETARELRQSISCPVIFVTAHTSERLINRMKEISPKGIIFKPFTGEDLVGLIRTTLEGS